VFTCNWYKCPDAQWLYPRVSALKAPCHSGQPTPHASIECPCMHEDFSHTYQTRCNNGALTYIPKVTRGTFGDIVWTLLFVTTCQPERGDAGGSRGATVMPDCMTLLLPVQVRSIDIHDRKLLTLSSLDPETKCCHHKPAVRLRLLDMTNLDSSFCCWSLDTSAQQPSPQLWYHVAIDGLT